MAKWMKIENNRIQTFAEEIWLWDDMIGMSVKVKVEKRPWTKIDPDFTHWHKVTKDGSQPDNVRSLEFKDEIVQEHLKEASNKLDYAVSPPDVVMTATELGNTFLKYIKP